jgi:hypothetical protein
MPLKLPHSPIFEIRCPNNVGIITLLLQGLYPLQKWFPHATIRMVAPKHHHHWLYRVAPKVELTTTPQKADYVITGTINSLWYQHRWQSLFSQFAPLGLRDPLEFTFPKGDPPDELASLTECITDNPDMAQWMALWNIPVIWACDPTQHNPLHCGPLGVRHTLIHENQVGLLSSTDTLKHYIDHCDTTTTLWPQWGLSIGIMGPGTTQLLPQFQSAGYQIHDINHQPFSSQSMDSQSINTIVFAEDLMPLHWAIKLGWQNTKQKWQKKVPYYIIEATSLFEFEHQLALR